MACGINVIAALLACATAASAVLAPFPHGKTTVYRYSTLVQTTNTEDAEFVSLFTVHGTLNIEHDTRDPELANAYNVVFSNIMSNTFNGNQSEHETTPVALSDDGARALQEPFLIVYHVNGTLQGVKIPENEAVWSKNMKMAMASTLQLDLQSMNLETMPDKPGQSFESQEKTTYGDCPTSYNVNKDSKAPDTFIVNKTFTPTKCNGFPSWEFNNVDNSQYKLRTDEPLYTTSNRLFEIEKVAGTGIVIKKLDAYGMMNVLSAKAASYPHYVTTNTTVELLAVKEKTEANTPLGNFADVPMTSDVYYRCTETEVAPGAMIDLTEGRRNVNQSDLIWEVSEMLTEAVDYMEENHMSEDKLDIDRAGLMNKMLRKMTFMDDNSLDRVFFEKKTDMKRVEKIQNIFLGLVSQVGTVASCRYVKKISMLGQIRPVSVIDILNKLPLNVKNPTTELLKEMEDLAKMPNTTPIEMRKAGILSFASLVYRTFKKFDDPENNPALNKYIQDFADRIMSEPKDEMKVVYLMALRNIEIGKVADILEPIVDGSVKITDDPERMRLLAIWAIEKPFERKGYATAKRVLWPIMTDASLPTKLRLAALEILMKQAPTEEDALNVNRYADSQDNEHFWNYHYTNLDRLAKNVDQKTQKLREVIYAIFEKSKYPREGRPKIHHPLSEVKSMAFVDDYFWHADKVDLSTVLNELTGMPEVMQVEYTVTDKNGAVSEMSIQVHIEGVDNMRSLIEPIMDHPMEQEAIRQLLETLARPMPVIKDLKVTVVVAHSGRVVAAPHYDYDSLEVLVNDILSSSVNNDRTAFGYNHVVLDRVYEKGAVIDIGVPVMIETRVPVVRSASFDLDNFQRFPHSWDMVMELKSWKHSDDSMRVYNPIGDAWHTVQAVSTDEVSFPLSVRFDRIEDDTPSGSGLRISFPKLPKEILPVAGFVDGGRHIVSVDEIGAPALAASCPTCKTRTVVNDGSVAVNYREGKDRERTVEFQDVGLKLTAGGHRCEYGFMSEVHMGYGPQWNITFDSHIPDTWMDSIRRAVWTMSGYVHSQYLDAQLRNCGLHVKLEPTYNNSIPYFELKDADGKYEDLDKNETIAVPHAEKSSFGISLHAISAETNETAHTLRLEVDKEFNRGHLANKLSLHITRKTPGQKNVKICIDAKKNYPTPPEDDLKLGTTNEEIDSKMTLTWGLTDGDECVRDEAVVAVTLKAKHSDEQKKRLKYDLENSDCSKDKKSPIFSGANVVPRTYNCLDEAIRYTTPRKYVFDVTHKKLSPEAAQWLYTRYTQRIKPRERGSFQFNIEFPMDKPTVDFQWMTNTSEFETNSVETPKCLLGVHGPTLNPLWDIPMDNSRYDLQHLEQYTNDDTRICSIYPKGLMTGDGVNVAFPMPSDKWTLMSGNHYSKEFAIFAKQPKPGQMSFLVVYRDHVVHFYTRESDNVFVAKANDVEKEFEGGFYLPVDSDYAIHYVVRKQNDHFKVRLPRLNLLMFIAPNYMSIMFQDEMQGNVSGMCGHLNGTNPNVAPASYSIANIDGY